MSLQIIVAPFCVILCLVISAVPKGTETDLEGRTTKEKVLKDLHTIKIKYHLSGSVVMNGLIEHVKFQMPHIKNIDNIEYQGFIDGIERLKCATSEQNIECISEATFENLRTIF